MPRSPIHTAILVAATLLACPAVAPAAEDSAGTQLQQAMIWAASAPGGRQAYVVFRKRFQLPAAPRRADLRLFADSRYILWINGRYVERGPCRFDPAAPEYDTLEVKGFLNAGENALAVLVHQCYDVKGPGQPGPGLNGRIMAHAPGLAAVLDLTDADGTQRVVRTDATWRASTQNRFTPSPADRWEATWASLLDRIDARRDQGDWTAAGLDDSAWATTVPIDGAPWGPLRPRRIPLLRETEVGPLTVVQWSEPRQLRGEPPVADLLPLEMKAGDWLVLDAGRFVQAYSVVDLEADDGSRLEIEYAQTFRTSGNKPGGSYGHVNHYTARAGRQTYLAGDTFGCKYVVLRLAAGRARLLGVKLVDRLYPFDVVGKFASSDPLLDEIWRLGVNTVQACSEDAYVDCATRERVEWLADAVMVAYPISRMTMAGPGAGGRPCYSDPRLFGSLLRHIGQSLQPDGRVKAHHPSDRWDIHGYIEDYSCLWIQGLRTWHDATGDLELAREAWPAVTAQLKWFLDRRTERGLVRAREFVYFGNPLLYQVCEGATLNAFLARALDDAAELARLLGHAEQHRQYAEAGQAIRKAINAHLWDEAAGAYHGAIKDGQKTPPTVHAAGICLYFDVVPPEHKKRVQQWFSAHFEREGCLPYQHAFYFEVFARMDTDAADRFVLDLIRKRWAPMARFETKTTWEGFSPGENCHESGGTPTIYLGRHVLGVQVDGPAAGRRLLVAPHLGDLHRAEGVVATEFGPVPVRWDQTVPSPRKRGEGQGEGALPSAGAARSGILLTFEVEIPARATARLSLPRLSDTATATVDGRPVGRPGNSSRRFAPIELGAGKHRGEVTSGAK
jgi:alpha-L-rhamnosidase